VVRPMFRLIARLGEREMFVVAALAVVVASAALMDSLGLSTALGAFVAGVMLADTPFRHEIEADVEPFRSILLGLFFLAVGMMLDLSVIAGNPMFVIGMTLALIAVKAAVIGALGLLIGMTWRSALALGLLLSQGGEFGFVLFTRAQQGLLIEPEAASLFGAIVTLSMMLTPLLMMVTRRMRREPEPEMGEREGPKRDGAGAIVIGYGRFGQTVAQMLITADIPVTIVDDDAEQIDVAEKFGAKVYYGDGYRLDLLRQAGAGEADIILFCDDREPEPQLLHEVREHFPQAKIYLRVYDRRSLIRLHGAPIDYAIREMFESAVEMARSALEELGDSLEEIDRTEAFYRDNDAERLGIQKDEGDMYAASDRIITQATREMRRDP
jgi:glutathione-regulated potassium-efflux system protein KefB